MGEKQAARAVMREVIKTYTYVIIWMSISIAVILFNKWLLAYSGFPYPIALTMWHMFFCSTIAFIAVRVLGAVKSHNMSPREYATRVMPIGALLHVQGDTAQHVEVLCRAVHAECVVHAHALVCCTHAEQGARQLHAVACQPPTNLLHAVIHPPTQQPPPQLLADPLRGALPNPFTRKACCTPAASGSQTAPTCTSASPSFR